MTSLPADGNSSVRAVRSLVDAFLAEDPLWQEWKGDDATILDVGDQEDHLVVAVRKGVVTFETISRDHRYLTAEFGRELDAWRFLIMQLGDSWRSDRRMRDINPLEMGWLRARPWNADRRGTGLPGPAGQPSSTAISTPLASAGWPGRSQPTSRRATATSTANRSSTWAYRSRRNGRTLRRPGG